MNADSNINKSAHQTTTGLKFKQESDVFKFKQVVMNDLINTIKDKYII